MSESSEIAYIFINGITVHGLTKVYNRSQLDEGVRELDGVAPGAEHLNQNLNGRLQDTIVYQLTIGKAVCLVLEGHGAHIGYLALQGLKEKKISCTNVAALNYGGVIQLESDLAGLVRNCVRDSEMEFKNQFAEDLQTWLSQAVKNQKTTGMIGQLAILGAAPI